MNRTHFDRYAYNFMITIKIFVRAKAFIHTVMQLCKFVERLYGLHIDLL